MSTIAERPSVKTCYECGDTLPLEDFPRRDPHSAARRGRCRPCYARYMREYRQAKREKAIHRFATEVARERNADRIGALVAGMLTRFGGLDGFCRSWTETIESARLKAPGSAAVLRAHMAMLRMIEVYHEQQADFEATGLTEEELERHTTEEVARLIQAQPELAIHAAQRLGWTVSPPSEI